LAGAKWRDFCRRDILKRHFRTHTWEMPLCGQCGRAFTQKSHVERGVGVTKQMFLTMSMLLYMCCSIAVLRIRSMNLPNSSQAAPTRRQKIGIISALYAANAYMNYSMKRREMKNELMRYYFSEIAQLKGSQAQLCLIDIY
jgi:hypothetical protein